MLKRSILLAALATMALAALTVACGGDDDDDKGTTSSSASTASDSAALLAKVPHPDQSAAAGSKVFVGHDKDNKASVGLTVFSDSTAVGYACDGNQTWTWFTGTANGNEVSLSASDGSKLTAKLDGSKATGSTSGGSSLSFTLDAATADNRAGLYRGTATDNARSSVAGWVVENDGFVRGGLNLTVNSTASRLGATFDPKKAADLQTAPEFGEIKAAIPGFPTIPADVTVFSVRGNLCGRIAVNLMEQTTVASPGVPDTALNRARLGLLGRLGCKQEALFALE